MEEIEFDLDELDELFMYPMEEEEKEDTMGDSMMLQMFEKIILIENALKDMKNQEPVATEPKYPANTSMMLEGEW
jgi:hypothetical protein